MKLAQERLGKYGHRFQAIHSDGLYGSVVVSHEGGSFSEHQQIVRDRGDSPVLLEDHLTMLRAGGFESECLHLHGNRALMIGRKS